MKFRLIIGDSNRHETFKKSYRKFEIREWTLSPGLKNEISIFVSLVFIFNFNFNFFQGNCKWIVVVFHFFLASIFSWFLSLALQAYHRFNDVIKQTLKPRFGIYILIGYGYPILLTLISLAIFYKDYGMYTVNDM